MSPIYLITDHNTFTAEPRSDASNPVLCAMIDLMYRIHWNVRIDSNPKFFIDEDCWKRLMREAKRNGQYLGDENGTSYEGGPRMPNDSDMIHFMGVPIYIVQLGTSLIDWAKAHEPGPECSDIVKHLNERP